MEFFAIGIVRSECSNFFFLSPIDVPHAALIAAISIRVSGVSESGTSLVVLRETAIESDSFRG